MNTKIVLFWVSDSLLDSGCWSRDSNRRGHRQCAKSQLGSREDKILIAPNDDFSKFHKMNACDNYAILSALLLVSEFFMYTSCNPLSLVSSSE